MEEIKREGAFSIRYVKGDEERAIDWDWLKKGRWTTSSREIGGVKWFDEAKELHCQDDYQEFLKRFGLLQWQNEFPLEKVVSMSPAQIAAVRREKENLHGLPRVEIKSDTLGNHYPAEEYV